MGSIALTVQQKVTEVANYVENATYTDSNGSLAKDLKTTPTQGTINVVKDYPWTVSKIKNREDVPYVRLVEYKCNQSSIQRQINFYSKLLPDTFGGAVGIDSAKQNTLEVYKEVFPKNEPTDFSYWFPYFNKNAFELSTPSWKGLDPIGEQLKSAAQGVSSFAKGVGFQGLGKLMDIGIDAVELAQAGAELSLQYLYPSVGVVDRPKVFNGHDTRTITIQFPLFNTLNPDDWQKNKALIYILMTQNLFNKRNLITGVPPVFYDILIPGQYFCYAAAMTNINVENLGNQRRIGNNIVPDAYQVTLTLTEMTMPSRNQFEVAKNDPGSTFVNSEYAPQTQNVTNEQLKATAANLIQQAQTP